MKGSAKGWEMEKFLPGSFEKNEVEGLLENRGNTPFPKLMQKGMEC